MRWQRHARTLTLGLILVGLVTVGVAQPDDSLIMERGRFAVTASEATGSAASGTFTIARTDAGGVEFIETLHATRGDQTMTFSTRMDLSGQYQPRSFLMSQNGERGTWTFTVRVDDDTARLSIQDLDGDTGTRRFQSDDGFAMWAHAPRLFGQAALLWRRVRQSEGSLHAQALLPGTADPLRPLEAERLAPVEIRHDGTSEEVARVAFTVGEAEPLRYELLGQGDQLYGTVTPGATEPLVYRTDLFPEGFDVVRSGD